jgi:hypothetical protein
LTVNYISQCSETKSVNLPTQRWVSQGDDAQTNGVNNNYTQGAF